MACFPEPTGWSLVGTRFRVYSRKAATASSSADLRRLLDAVAMEREVATVR